MKHRIILATFTFSLSVYLASAQTKPNPKLTPGVLDPAVTQSTTQSTICNSGYTQTVRDVPDSMKHAVATEYGLKWPLKPGAFEIDHWIPLEVGGANDIRNLWPQPAVPVPGFHQKDVVETYLKRQVCAGAMTLKQAQDEILEWVAVWRKLETAKK